MSSGISILNKVNICISIFDHQFSENKYDYFLGNWAIQNPEDLKRTIPNPIFSQEKLEKTNEEVDDTLSRMLNSLSSYMNAYFNTKLSTRFWKIYLTPFLLHWISSNYFRYLALDQLRSKIQESSSIACFNFIKNEKDFVIKSNEDYIAQIIYLNSYSHVDFQRLIRFMFEGFFEINHELPTPSGLKLKAVPENKFRVFSREIFSFGGKYYLGNVKGLNILDKSKIAIRNLPSILFSIFSNLFKSKHWGEIRPEISKNSLSNRLTDWGFVPTSEFEKIAAQLIIDLLPDDLFEPIPRQPLLKRVSFWVGNAPNIYRNISVAIGRIVENGGKWISVQHGGVYGHVYKNGYANIEYVLTDHFVTWGWKDSPPYNVKPIVLSSPILSKFKNKKRNPGSKILYIGTVGVYIPYRITSVMQTITLSEYKDIQLQFVKQLSVETKKSLWFRDHSVSLNLDHEFYHHLKEQNIPFCKKFAYLAAAESRLVVVDHCSTSFLETMVMNIPTVMFWNEDVAKLNSVAYKEFLKLKAVGIWHESGLDAANFINKNYSRIEEWWNSSEVQQVKNDFLELYGKTSDYYIREWAHFLSKLKL